MKVPPSKFLLFALAMHLPGMAHALTFTKLVDFSNTADPAAGSTPSGRLVLRDGKLYGSTEAGGAGSGVIYRYDLATQQYDVLVRLSAASAAGVKPPNSDGIKPTGLIEASDGHFYASTIGGGQNGEGALLQITSGGTLTRLYSFLTAVRAETGVVPLHSLVRGTGDLLYGTTSEGGLGNAGTIFRLSTAKPTSVYIVAELTGATGQAPGSKPSELIRARDGNFYGTAEAGGVAGNGLVFRLTPDGKYSKLVEFAAGSISSPAPRAPRAALVEGRDGSLYGTTALGGKRDRGTVFRVTREGKLQVLANFTGSRAGTARGSTPETPLTLATDGNFYGVTREGGSSSRGTLFRITADGVMSTLIDFTGQGEINQGSEPRSPLLQDNDGNFYGTTATAGANGVGILYRVSGLLPPKSIITPTIATEVTGTRARLNARVNTQGTAGSFWFEYGTGPDYGSRVPQNSLPMAARTGNVNYSTVVTGLQPNALYNFRIVARNGGGTAFGENGTFTTGPHPEILTQPANVLELAGAAATFSVAASGTTAGTPVKYAWRKNGGGDSLGKSASYTIPKLSLSHAGLYSVVVSKSPDRVVSRQAVLAVLRKIDRAVPAIQGSTVTCKLDLAAPPGAGLAFQWKKDGSALVDNARITGATTQRLTLSNATDADNGNYTCDVTLGGTTKESGEYQLSVLMRPVVGTPAFRVWTTNGFLQAGELIPATANATSYSISGLPRGVRLNPKTGVLSGRPVNDGEYLVLLIARNAAGASAPVPATIRVLPPVPGAVGRFQGLIPRSSTTNDNLGGLVDIYVGATGAVTGRAVHAGRTYRFISKLSDAPQTLRSISPVVMRGTPALTAEFTLNQDTGVITGTMNSQAVTASRGMVQPEPLQGTYNFALQPEVADQSNEALPQGCGTGLLSVRADGGVTWVCRLGDGNAGGRAFTATSVVNAAALIPLHQSLYAAGTGSVQGELKLESAGTLIETAIDWLKLSQPAGAKTRIYKSGFALHRLEAEGTKYVPPLAGVNVLGFANATGNAELVFSMGGLTQPIAQTLTLPSSNRPQISLPNPNNVSLKLNPARGTFSGEFTIPDAVAANVRKVAFEGILLPHRQVGLGRFLLPQLPGPRTSPVLAGRVELRAK